MDSSTYRTTQKWWVETDGGRVVFGPCIDREMALSVRTVIEGYEARTDLWVRQNDDRDGWVVWNLGRSRPLVSTH